MVLSPVEIHDKEFDSKFRGYDRDQVNDFLKQAAQDYNLALQKNAELEKQLKDTTDQLKYFTDMKDALNQSILVAQEAAEKVKSESEQEAQIIVEESQKKARDLLNQSTDKSNRILQDASDRARQVTIETDNLKKSVNSFRQGLQGMLKQQLDMVENPEWSKLNDSTSTEKLKQEIGDQANGTTQDYQPNVQNNENMQDQVSKSDQMNYNDNIQNDQPDESYTINHQQNEPTFNFQDDADGDSKEN
ncbi:cell-division initiation protein (septum placement) [Companilactobacillus paralimentarius DSM 13238 = JCM 10415]|uniref:Cell-division initiation protein (Septum placement) n=1 Tax=Companilactobacillus paralimentarius DSM 13238 = JCM 10415 TaxID=1122151 RepID=A0A0R1PTS0_9LACO|nr:DivIVA domain-containing protein [Companilactobacillus paralimentarius]KAE9564019.1 arabinan synthesis protein [Companilactobacillus paralimentarius]KRL32211.1 cell-division initiation protein (septum placement) [Companilactobacillus paralimentarius DSM 13238 = JCM 10415]MDR4933748.1 DivIVA domain-containing protein [Companilactobacillus paralimentarius]QFR70188.1 DivIVA domain-containing protein [Companilactobacillus paralimentarius]